MRLFIAIDLPNRVRAWALERRNELRNRWPDAGLRWTPIEQWHVTLQFLGECPEHQLTAVQDAMKRAATGRSPFAIALGKPGTFSGPRMGVLWLGVESGRQALTDLAYALRGEKQPYQPHVTLARSRVKIPAQTLRKLSPSLPSPCPEATIERMTLYRSILDATGARYEAVAICPFKPS